MECIQSVVHFLSLIRLDVLCMFHESESHREQMSNVGFGDVTDRGTRALNAPQLRDPAYCVAFLRAAFTI